MIKEVIAYAATLAIRVIPEFDNPGHVRAIGLDPEFRDIIICFNKEWQFAVPNAYTVNGGPPTGILDPSNEKSYTLLKAILQELEDNFPGDFVHLGGDEVNKSCFENNQPIADFMKLNNITGYDELVSFYINKSRDILTNINSKKRAIYWSNEDTFYMKH